MGNARPNKYLLAAGSKSLRLLPDLGSAAYFARRAHEKTTSACLSARLDDIVAVVAVSSAMARAASAPAAPRAKEAWDRQMEALVEKICM